MTIETMGYFLGAIQENQPLFARELPLIMKCFIEMQKGLVADDPH